MRDSNVANPAKESAQAGFPHGLLDFCTTSRGRFDPFATSSANYRILRNPANLLDVSHGEAHRCVSDSGDDHYPLPRSP
jgi:hypothetical protein